MILALCFEEDQTSYSGFDSGIAGSPYLRQELRLFENGLRRLFLLVGRVAVPSEDALCLLYTSDAADE